VTTVADVDRLVIVADSAVARRWPRLGPKVRAAYLDDRNRWIEIRRGPDGGATSSAATLDRQRRVFEGWLRAFRAVAARPHAQKARVSTSPALPNVPAAAPLSTPSAPMLPTTPSASRGSGGAGAAVAGGLVLAGLVAAAAARRRRA
jgi:hypothetical protein